MSLHTLYASSVASIRPSVNHARIPDSERRFVVTVNGKTHYTDSPSRVARLTDNGKHGTVTDRLA